MQEIPVRHIASTNNEQTNSGRFRIRDLRTIFNGKNLVQDLHRHDFFFILLVEKGKGTHQIDFTNYPVRNHSVFLIRPGQVHQLELKAGSTGFIMEFDSSFYRSTNKQAIQRFQKASNKNYCKPETVRFKKLMAALNYIKQEFVNQQEGCTDSIKALLDIFFIEFVRQSPAPNNVSKNINNYTQERFEELLVLLESKITEFKNVSQYAGLMNLSSYQLNSITKASVGKTVSDLINEQIILEAKRQLLATPAQVKDIAWDLGYEDASYFIRFFKKHTGHSPDVFRQNFK